MTLYVYFFAYNFFTFQDTLVINSSFEITQLGQTNNTINLTIFVVGG